MLTFQHAGVDNKVQLLFGKNVHSQVLEGEASNMEEFYKLYSIVCTFGWSKF
jgi:hypothetical protein